ncbi:hypothetical protein BDF20DRAFT_860317 [Mycotypha africana]|uniref:uncharacterized protein n=1 Tax=Mycotypha africana TaxID=64632 RepID=UPI0023003C20|nr:uncharacterized protein BDF20DRAFT_860317 [Mycotypha africana]KAI8984502.1 hypothetical protein BDF20DRAFT_860317 [Mycotypha africana]
MPRKKFTRDASSGESSKTPGRSLYALSSKNGISKHSEHIVAGDCVPEVKSDEVLSAPEGTPDATEGDSDGFNEDETDDDRDFGSIPIRSRQRFTTSEKKELEDFYRTNDRPNTNEKQMFADRFRTTPGRIQIWFQNRRAKQKKMVEGSSTEKIDNGYPNEAEIGMERRETYDKRRAKAAKSASPGEGSHNTTQHYLTKRRKSNIDVLRTSQEQPHLQNLHSLPMMSPMPQFSYLQPFANPYNMPRDSMVPNAEIGPSMFPPPFPTDRFVVTPHPAIVRLQQAYPDQRLPINPEEAYVDPIDTEIGHNLGEHCREINTDDITPSPVKNSEAKTLGSSHKEPPDKI